MENYDENDLHAGPKLIVTEDVRSYIFETTKWTRFMSVLGFIAAAVFAIAGFSAGAIMSAALNATMNSFEYGAADRNMIQQGGTITWMIILFLYSLFIFYPSLVLYKYSNLAARAVKDADQEAFSQSAVKMKSFFKFYGIVSIIWIGVSVISMLFVLSTSY